MTNFLLILLILMLIALLVILKLAKKKGVDLVELSHLDVTKYTEVFNKDK